MEDELDEIAEELTQKILEMVSTGFDKSDDIQDLIYNTINKIANQ